MRAQIQKNRPTALRGHVLLAMGLAFTCLASHADAESVSKLFGDDIHTSKTSKHPYIQYDCPWITRGLAKFKVAHADWNFTYAGSTAASFLETDLKVEAYYPWVVTQPTYSRTFTNPDGSHTTKKWGGSLNGECGGAYLSLSYTPRPGDPTDIRWIQGISSSYYGSARDVHLDNPSDRNLPFYDVGTQDLAGSTYFVDIPGAAENEYESNPVAAVDFQAFIAKDNGRKGAFAHDVTVYGGIWWGYTYTATEVPEPISLAVLGIGALGIVRRRRTRRLAF